MEIRIMKNGTLKIDNARITYKNFSGKKTDFNREGERNFSLIIDSAENADLLKENGWNVKIKQPREEGDLPFMYLKVKVSYKFGGPNVYLNSGKVKRILDEETIGSLDGMEIESIDMDLRPSFWTMNGNKGVTPYLDSMWVTQHMDRFAARFFSDDEESE